MIDDAVEQHTLVCQDRIETMADEEIRRAYLATDGMPGNQWVDLLADALETRGIDV